MLWLLACATEPVPATAPAPEAPAADAPVAGTISAAPILDTPSILGALEEQAVEDALDFAAIKACNTSGEPGKVLVRFRIEESGAVEETRIRSTTLRHPATEDCLQAQLRATTFPAPTSGAFAIVSWPFSI